VNNLGLVICRPECMSGAICLKAPNPKLPAPSSREAPSTNHQFGMRGSIIPSSFACRAVALAKAGHSPPAWKSYGLEACFVIPPPITFTIGCWMPAREGIRSWFLEFPAKLVPGRGLEPLRISPPDPKSGASANFATLVRTLPLNLRRFAGNCQSLDQLAQRGHCSARFDSA
jgi:hypothetical protein